MKNSIYAGNAQSGKTTKLFNLVDKYIEEGSNLFINDLKGEYLEKYESILEDNGYNIVKLNLKDINNTIQFNPLLIAYDYYNKGDKVSCDNIIDTIADAFYKSSNEAIDPFWDNSASNLFKGIVLYLIKQGNKDNINFKGIYNLIDDETIINNIDKDSTEYLLLSDIYAAPKETKGGIIAVAKQKLSFIVSKEGLNYYYEDLTINMDDIVNKKTAFIYVNYENTLCFLNNLIIQILMYYISKSNVEYKFILDNFDSVGYINNFDLIISSTEYNNIDFIISTRNIDLLINKYPYLKNVSNIISV